MRIAYETKNFNADTLAAIRQANEILVEYEQQGYDLTLRQLYYQHVARGLILNTEQSYKRLGSIVNDARLTGHMDWDHIVDRTRNIRALTHWRDPAHIITATARSYKVDLWEAQGDYVEVWIEKDALVGVIAGVSEELDVPYFSCRGYTSQSEMWAAGQRLLEQAVKGKRITILHLGDHDPSGIDMTRDIKDRLEQFVGQDYARHMMDADENWDTYSETNQDVTIRQWINDVLDRLTINRIALTMDQVQQYNPPPNFAKLTDSRSGIVRRQNRIVGIKPGSYIDLFSDLDASHDPLDRAQNTSSWELDALPPDVLSGLVRTHVEALIDNDVWDKAVEREQDGQRLLRQASQRWTEIVESLNGGEPEGDEDA
jgi:hypothetical protein